ncbi:hypothetical protein VP01_1222g1 [Puccinia sorghi]|uniref:Integrase catalytic domain-containing protein n=1 Tax=Puccinia sorghi TaxID=27349 RepID=A0A0L6VQ14_9BASI|nr:hypothetical protein VP01_1222g1 [Puccinia sorghi]
MVSNRNLFITLDKTEGGMINTSCGTNTLAIKGRGTISVCYNKKPLLFHDVLFVPNITVNLLSMRQLLLEKFQIEFNLNNFAATKANEIKLEGYYRNNLPMIEFENLGHVSHLSQAEVLHKSLGHVSYSRIRNKLGIPINPPGSCKACAVSKITKASYKHRSSKASKPFEELHLDLIGPVTTMSHKGHRYILTIVDANTRFCSAIPLKTKSDVFATLTHVINTEAKRLGYFPSILHSDRGTEFVNAGLEEYCRSNIIRQRFSNAYTPQQNGLAERFNRTILESLRTILYDSGFRLNMWNEVISACILTLNQIPTHRSNKSPFELFKGRTIPLDFFRPIGNPTVVYSHGKKDKLAPRGNLGKLIGFNTELKSYRILMNDGRMLESKNVEFLDFETSPSSLADHDELLVEETKENLVKCSAAKESESNPEIPEVKIEEEEESPEDQDKEKEKSGDDSDDVDVDIAEILVPKSSTPRIPECFAKLFREKTPLCGSKLLTLSSIQSRIMESIPQLDGS